MKSKCSFKIKNQFLIELIMYSILVNLQLFLVLRSHFVLFSIEFVAFFISFDEAHIN